MMSQDWNNKERAPNEPDEDQNTAPQKVRDLLRLVRGTTNERIVGKTEAEDAPTQRWNTGVAELDECLPPYGLSGSGLHEIEPLKPADTPSLTGFCFALLSRLQSSKPIIWCVTRSQIGDYGQPYAFGFSRFGISPSQIIFARVSKERDLPFALEEAIKTHGVAAVLGEGARPGFTGSRRISLLCKTHKTPCVLMTSNPENAGGSAALTRFQIKPLPGVENPLDPFGPGLPHWQVALPRIRGAPAMPGMELNQQTDLKTSYPWRIAWDEQTLSFRSASTFRGAETHQAGEADAQVPNAMVGR
jgi:protein ImuA